MMSLTGAGEEQGVRSLRCAKEYARRSALRGIIRLTNPGGRFLMLRENKKRSK